MVHGLTKSYRRARRKIPDDWEGASTENLHELRRRVIDHRYQIDLLHRCGHRVGKSRLKKTQRLRERLGCCQDLVVLSEVTAPGRLLAAWRQELSEPIAERRAVHLAAAAGLARDLFAERPKAFRRGLKAG
jgi:CHAD domain-containing protein